MVDPDMAAWILEFLFRQRDVNLGLAIELFLALPLPSPLPPRLSAALLIRRLSADLSSLSISLRTLDTLAFIHRLYPLPSLLPAFVAVAVQCTVAPLRQCSISFSSTDADVEFFDAVNKIWNCRMDDLERSELAGLVSPALREARKEMETAVVDPALREELARRETKEAALDALRLCLAEASKEMGPTFLEAAAEAIISRDCEEMTGNNIDRSLAALGDKMSTLYSSWFEPVETGKQVLSTPSKTDKSSSTVLKELVHNSKNIKLTGPDIEQDHEVGASATMTEQTKENFDCKACKHALLSDQLEPLRSDPEDVVQKQTNVLADKASPPAENFVSCSSLDANIASNLDIAKTKRPSLMDRNATAHTLEWDSPVSQSAQSANPTRKVSYLSSSNTSALDETGEFTLRRRKRKWSLMEEETLRKAVAECGVGNWKFIKSRHLDIFKRRTEVDLKDKWRNMSRYS